VLGPTATGKTQLAVKLAGEFSGEIISADSRQVYRGMDIGTGKDLSEYFFNDNAVKYHLIDILEPGQDYSVFQFKQDFVSVFNNVLIENHIPILCGGTGLYIDSILRDYNMPAVPSNPELRQTLEGEPLDKLRLMLKDLNPELHNTTDLEHRKRLIRAIEIAKYPIDSSINYIRDNEPILPAFNFLILGIRYPRDEIRKRITSRLRTRLNEGMIQEVEALIDRGIEYSRLDYFGLEYRFISQHLMGKLSWNDMYQKLNTAIHQFAKRQMTFFRSMERNGLTINWLDGGDHTEAVKFVSDKLGDK